MSIGTRLRNLRDAAKLTQAQLAEMVGLSKSGLAYIEQGLREPGWGTVQALAKALGVDCTAFVDDESEESAVGEEAKRGRGRPTKVKEEPEDQAAKKPSAKKRKGKE